MVLIGALLVSVSLGPYTNWDSEVEFAAASSVAQSGFPYATPGNLINQPPIAFYINGLFLSVFGTSYATGVAAVTLFGVGCVFLVYQIGKTVYEDRVGLVAAGLFALTPWHVVLSRSFLIDVQCLFFSLLSLLIGIWAIRKTSLNLTLVSGIVFGIALLTKLFAVFTLIPLALLFAHYVSGKLRRSLSQILLFVLPSFLMHYSWYELISRLGFFSVFTHTDFLSGSQGLVPSPFFLLRFFVGTPGLVFLLAASISAIIALWMKDLLGENAFFDIVWIATVLGTAGVNMFLVLNLGLWVPYVDPVKYDFQLLPPLCWLVSSISPRALSLLSHNSVAMVMKRRRLLLALALVGLVLLAGTFLLNLVSLLTLLEQDFLLFRVEGDVGFSFLRLTPFFEQNLLVPFQSLGFMLIVAALIWVNKNGLSETIRLFENAKKRT